MRRHPPILAAPPEVGTIVTLQQPQFRGGRRVIPLFADDTVRRNLGALLDQGVVWVVRGRWVRWLDHADPADTVPIATMLPDERLAARAWLRQQRHDIHRTLGHAGPGAPDGWIEKQPLYDALAR